MTVSPLRRRVPLQRIGIGVFLNGLFWTLLLGIIVICSTVYWFHTDHNFFGASEFSRLGKLYLRNDEDTFPTGKGSGTGKPEVTIGMAICGDRLEEAVTLLKSAIIFSRNARLRIIAYQDEKTSKGLSRELNELQSSATHLGVEFKFQIQDSWFPNETDNRDWRSWFAPCSTQRLFFPTLLPDVEKLAYLDTDTIFMADVLDLWNNFDYMNHGEMAAMAAEHELPGDGWYNLYAKFPYYGSRGLNAGVMLMNLTAMRLADFEGGIHLVNKAYGGAISWADQDLMNVYFHFHNKTMRLLTCEFNYRVQHCECQYHPEVSCKCVKAEEEGISVLHGNRFMFHKYANFSMNIYNAFREYQLESNEPEKLLDRLQQEYQALGKDRPCSGMPISIFNKFAKYLGITPNHNV